MSFGADEEILQDFLVEAGEILELLSEQLVELESRPNDADLLNAIFRGFHTVKGGAGFLQLHELVECCHIAENVFDILRKGERGVDAELMDVVLEALDAVNGMFSEVRERRPITAATPELLAALARLAEPATAHVVAAPEPVPVAVVAAPVTDITDSEFEQLLESLDAVKAAAAEPEPVTPTDISASDEISDAEFELLLDQLHGKGQFSADAAVVSAVPDGVPDAAADVSNEITDDEFEALLDQLHGKGSFNTDALSAAVAEPVAIAQEPAGDPNLISDHEFEALLDEMHGKGKFSAESAAVVAAAVPAKPVAAARPAPARAPAAPSEKPVASEAETTVRVDTARLDDIMNMVGELVLVRNRLVRLGLNSHDEEMAKALSNLDVVTADLQTP